MQRQSVSRQSDLLDSRPKQGAFNEDDENCDEEWRGARCLYGRGSIQEKRRPPEPRTESDRTVPEPEKDIVSSARFKGCAFAASDVNSLSGATFSLGLAVNQPARPPAFPVERGFNTVALDHDHDSFFG